MVQSAVDDVPKINPATATTEEISRAMLPWARGLLKAAVGPQAVEYAGLGVMEAIDQYDPRHAVPFYRFAAKTILWTARKELRRVNGRGPGERNRAVHRSVSLTRVHHEGSWVAKNLSAVPNLAADLEEHEMLAESLRTVDKIEGPARWVVLGRFLGDFDNSTLERVLGRERRHIYRFIADLRRSWQTD